MIVSFIPVQAANLGEVFENKTKQNKAPAIVYENLAEDVLKDPGIA